jgi:hypothetical protein
MALGRRNLPFEVPRYSLTGDIFSFKRCPLQYRYYNKSSLPPSRPVQLWTGEFIHGVLEEAYRYWQQRRPPFPWPCNPTPWPPPQTPLERVENDIGKIGDAVEARLAAAGKRPRNTDARDIAYRRAEATINLLGPELFPLITDAERRVSQTRPMPPLTQQLPTRGDRYELTGVVDVISHLSIQANPQNSLVQMLQAHCLNPPFEIIIDYKAQRRPPNKAPRHQHHELQVQTYAWLLRQIPQSTPVRAAMIVYINELVPSKEDFRTLQQEVRKGSTDVIPSPESDDYYAIVQWNPRTPVPELSNDFRLRRAIRIVKISTDILETAIKQIDKVVKQIEKSAAKEHFSKDIPSSWRATGLKQDCAACDFRHFCPNPAPRSSRSKRHLTPPSAPG